MNFLFLFALITSLMVILSLPFSLAAIPALQEYSIFCFFVVSAFVSGLIFYFLFLRPFREMRKKELQSQLSLLAIEAEKAKLQSQLDILENLVSRDSLTGIWNKSYCLNRLQEELQRVRRYGGTFSVLMIDLDNFKVINDNLGHLTGDDYLIAVANHINCSTRLSDVNCRFGGDEFLIILPDTTQKGAMVTAEKLRRGAGELQLNPHYPLTLSIGVCSNCEHFNSLEDIINCADMALYNAKKAGRNRVTAASVPN